MSWSSSRSWRGCAPGIGSSGTSGIVGSLASNAAESMRTPPAPRSNQKRRISSCSARTSGWSQCRSGCCGGEQVEVPLARSSVGVRRAGPGLAAAEFGRPTGRRLVARWAAPRSEPEPVTLRGARSGREGSLEPFVAIGHMVGNDVDDRADAQRSGFGDERLRLLERAEGRIDRPVVGDVIAAVREGGEVPRREPDGVDPEVAQVGES